MNVLLLCHWWKLTNVNLEGLAEVSGNIALAWQETVTNAGGMLKGYSSLLWCVLHKSVGSKSSFQVVSDNRRLISDAMNPQLAILTWLLVVILSGYLTATEICTHGFPLISPDRSLGNNIFSTLPTLGLSHIHNLQTFGNPYLKDFPPAKTFEDIQYLTLSYAYHCCEFLPKEETKVWAAPPYWAIYQNGFIACENMVWLWDFTPFRTPKTDSKRMWNSWMQKIQCTPTQKTCSEICPECGHWVSQRFINNVNAPQIIFARSYWWLFFEENLIWWHLSLFLSLLPDK